MRPWEMASPLGVSIPSPMSGVGVVSDGVSPWVDVRVPWKIVVKHLAQCWANIIEHDTQEDNYYY